MIIATFKHKVSEAWLDVKAETSEIAEAKIKDFVKQREHWTLISVKEKKPLFQFG